MKTGSKILKVIAFIIGTLSFAYGFLLGVLGSGPDGPQSSILIRIAGIYVLTLGASYIYSNKNKLHTMRKYYFFMLFELTPLIVLIGAMAYTVVSEGMASFIEFGALQFICLGIMSLVSPASLLFAKNTNLLTKSLEQTA